MLESAEIGHRISKQVYAREEPVVMRPALLYPAKRRAHTMVNTSGLNIFPV